MCIEKVRFCGEYLECSFDLHSCDVMSCVVSNCWPGLVANMFIVHDQDYAHKQANSESIFAKWYEVFIVG